MEDRQELHVPIPYSGRQLSREQEFSKRAEQVRQTSERFNITHLFRYFASYTTYFTAGADTNFFASAPKSDNLAVVEKWLEHQQM